MHLQGEGMPPSSSGRPPPLFSDLLSTQPPPWTGTAPTCGAHGGELEHDDVALVLRSDGVLPPLAHPLSATWHRKAGREDLESNGSEFSGQGMEAGCGGMDRGIRRQQAAECLPYLAGMQCTKKATSGYFEAVCCLAAQGARAAIECRQKMSCTESSGGSGRGRLQSLKDRALVRGRAIRNPRAYSIWAATSPSHCPSRFQLPRESLVEMPCPPWTLK